MTFLNEKSYLKFVFRNSIFVHFTSVIEKKDRGPGVVGVKRHGVGGWGPGVVGSRGSRDLGWWGLKGGSKEVRGVQCHRLHMPGEYLD